MAIEFAIISPSSPTNNYPADYARTQATVTAVITTIKASSRYRLGGWVAHISGPDVYVGLVNTVTASDTDGAVIFKMKAGDIWNFADGNIVYTGDLFGITASGTAYLTIVTVNANVS